MSAPGNGEFHRQLWLFLEGAKWTALIGLGVALVAFWMSSMVVHERERYQLWRMCDAIRDLERRQLQVAKLDCAELGLSPDLPEPFVAK